MSYTDTWNQGFSEFETNSSDLIDKVEEMVAILADIESGAQAVIDILEVVSNFVSSISSMLQNLVSSTATAIKNLIDGFLGTGGYVCLAHNVTWNNGFYDNVAANTDIKYWNNKGRHELGPVGIVGTLGEKDRVKIGARGFCNFENSNSENRKVTYPLKGGDLNSWLSVVEQAARNSENFFSGDTGFGGLVAVFGVEVGNFQEFYDHLNLLLKARKQEDRLMQSFKKVCEDNEIPASEVRVGGPAPAIFKMSVSNNEEGTAETQYSDAYGFSRSGIVTPPLYGTPSDYKALRKLYGSNGSVFIGSSVGDLFGRQIHESIARIVARLNGFISTSENVVQKIIQVIEDMIVLFQLLIEALRTLIETILNLLEILSKSYILEMSVDSDPNSTKGFFSLIQRAKEATDIPEFHPNSAICGFFMGYGYGQASLVTKFKETMGVNIEQFKSTYTNAQDALSTSTTETWNNYTNSMTSTWGSETLTT